MCGRFALGRSPEDLRDFFDLVAAPDCAPRYNIAPGTPILAIRATAAGRRAELLRWGLIPHWAQDERLGYAMINARAETAATKPAFRDAFRRRRCLIPADGFYEWQPQTSTRVKQPYFISRRDGAPLAFAGLWERWCAPDREPIESIESCTILITVANALLAPIHDRMPVLLDPQDFATWLDPGSQDTALLTGLLRPYPADPLQAVPVGRRVGNPRNEDPRSSSH